MKRILIVKITSLGDVVMAQPVIADIHRAFPDAIVDWATDEAFAEIPAWNPGVNAVHCAPLRGFKKHRDMAGAMAILRSVRQLRQYPYDAVIDIHGAYKSAIIAFLARGKQRFGYPNAMLGERGAAFAYSDRVSFPEGLDAVAMMRASVADALGYTVEGVPSFNLKAPPAMPATTSQTPSLSASRQSTPALPRNTVLLLHGASKPEKCWPVASWIALGQVLQSLGFSLALPWHSDEEHARADAIAAGLPGARVLPRMSLSECARVVESAALVVGVDTGLTHLAQAFERPTVKIFSATSRDHYGFDSPGISLSVGDEGRLPDVNEVLDAVYKLLSGIDRQATRHVEAGKRTKSKEGENVPEHGVAAANASFRVTNRATV